MKHFGVINEAHHGRHDRVNHTEICTNELRVCGSNKLKGGEKLSNCKNQQHGCEKLMYLRESSQSPLRRALSILEKFDQRQFFSRPTPDGSRQVVYQAGKTIAFCKLTELKLRQRRSWRQCAYKRELNWISTQSIGWHRAEAKRQQNKQKKPHKPKQEKPTTPTSQRRARSVVSWSVRRHHGVQKRWYHCITQGIGMAQVPETKQQNKGAIRKSVSQEATNAQCGNQGSPQPGASISQSASRTGNILTDSWIRSKGRLWRSHVAIESRKRNKWDVAWNGSKVRRTRKYRRSGATQSPLTCALSIISINGSASALGGNLRE